MSAHSNLERKAAIAAANGMTIAEYEKHMKKQSRQLTQQVRKDHPNFGKRYRAPGKGK